MRGVGFAGSGMLGSEVLRLAFYLALARIAVPADFGEYAAAAALVAIGYLLTDSGMLAALVHRRDRVEEAANTALIATLLGGLALSLAALAAAPLIGVVFDSDRIAALAAVLSGLLVLRSATIVPDALLQRRFSFRRRTVVEPLGAIAFGSVAIVATSNGLGAWGLVAGQYANALVEVVMIWAFCRWRPRPGLASRAIWRELIGYGRHVIAGGMLDKAGQQVDTILVGRFLGSGLLGQYRVGFRLGSTPYLFLLAVASWVLFPAFARIATDRDRFRRAFVRSFGWIATVGFPLSLIMLPLGEPIALVLLGGAWRDAGHVMMAMALYPAASALISVTLEAVKADGDPQRLPEAQAIVVALTALAMVAGLSLFGLVGVAAGLSIGALGGVGYAVRVLQRTLPVATRELVGVAVVPLVAALAMVAVVWPLELLLVDAGSHGTGTGALLLAGEAAVGAAVFLSSLRLLRPQAWRELTVLIRLGAGRGVEAPAS